MELAIDQLLAGSVTPSEIALLLTALHHKGESAAEIAGAARGMRRHMVSISCQHAAVLDTCGTGGIGSQLFNISTAAALVAAAAGVPVAKHGNRSVTSKSGSADVLSELGINIDASPAIVERCLNELGICFCFAPAFHPAMKHVAPVRKQLGFATIFNLLGPLCNPAGATRQLLGVGRPELQATMAEVLALLGTEHAAVVHGTDGIGEVSLAAPTEVIEVTGAVQQRFTWRAEDFGLASAAHDALRVGSAGESAAIVHGVLAGKLGAQRDVVVLNAAAALWAFTASASPAECAQRAAAAIDSGAAAKLLEAWKRLSFAKTL